jgi:hypothetical protein
MNYPPYPWLATLPATAVFFQNYKALAAFGDVQAYTRASADTTLAIYSEVEYSGPPALFHDSQNLIVNILNFLLISICTLKHIF